MLTKIREDIRYFPHLMAHFMETKSGVWKTINESARRGEKVNEKPRKLKALHKGLWVQSKTAIPSFSFSSSKVPFAICSGKQLIFLNYRSQSKLVPFSVSSSELLISFSTGVVSLPRGSPGKSFAEKQIRNLGKIPVQ